MIVRILSSGSSFKGLAAYLTHDPQAQTAERVAWTHTHNLANDHVASAVDEMYWTAQNAELLKQEAGIRAGGRATENPVKHVSLNWSPDDSPTREHMIATAEEFLRHMQWQEHQALMVAHRDKEHAHVHLMLSKINPQTGLQLDDNFERRRAQTWALGYELENGMVYCGQRLQRPGEREDAPTRDAWLAFAENKKEFEREENARKNQDAHLAAAPENTKITDCDAWKMLKDIQRGEREAFFATGKPAFSDLRTSIYREVREEFRERWSDYFTAHQEGAHVDTLKSLKMDLIAEQKAMLEGRRDAACADLRDTRAGLYRQLLDGQMEIRHDLRATREAGLDTDDFRYRLEEHAAYNGLYAAFHEAAAETGAPTANSDRGADAAVAEENEHETAVDGPGAHMGADIGVKVGGGLISLFGGFLVEFVNTEPDAVPRQARGSSLFEAAAEEAQKRQQREQREEADREWRERERARCWD